MLILVIQNHDTEKSNPNDVLTDLPEDLKKDIHIATECFMGHGLFDQAIHPLDDVLEDYQEYIFDRGQFKLIRIQVDSTNSAGYS